MYGVEDDDKWVRLLCDSLCLALSSLHAHGRRVANSWMMQVLSGDLISR